MDPQQRAQLAELRRLVNIEREEERRLHLEVIQRLPLVQRIAKGYCWYPLVVVKQGFGIGGRPYVTLSRQGTEEHQFRSGTSVNFFTQQSGVHRPQLSGVIQYVKKNTMEIIFSGQDLPEWLGGRPTRSGFDVR